MPKKLGNGNQEKCMSNFWLTPSKKRPIRGHQSSMLSATGNIQPPRINSGGASKNLGSELLWDPKVPLFTLPTRLPRLVIPPNVNCSLCRKNNRLRFPKYVHPSSVSVWLLRKKQFVSQEKQILKARDSKCQMYLWIWRKI